MNWNNVDLNSDYERSQNILEPYDFETLLLEISCNCKVINEETIKRQFYESVKSKLNSAKDVFNANIESIIAKAQEERNE